MFKDGPGGLPLITDNEFRILRAIATEPTQAYGYSLQAASRGNAFTLLQKLSKADVVDHFDEGKKKIYQLTPYGWKVFRVYESLVEQWQRDPVPMFANAMHYFSQNGDAD